MAKMKYKTIKINVTFQKVIIWISGLWLFILAIVNSFPNVNVNTKFFVHNNTGDNGAIILITAFLFICVTTFINHKIAKLVAGIIFITIAIIGMIRMIGAIINSTKEVSTLVIIFGELIALIVALIWLLEGIGTIRVNKTNTASTPSNNK